VYWFLFLGFTVRTNALSIGTAAAIIVTAASALPQMTRVTPSSFFSPKLALSTRKTKEGAKKKKKKKKKPTWKIPPTKLRQRRALDKRRGGGKYPHAHGQRHADFFFCLHLQVHDDLPGNNCEYQIHHSGIRYFFLKKNLILSASSSL
jgi:hypothetical protein